MTPKIQGKIIPQIVFLIWKHPKHYRYLNYQFLPYVTNINYVWVEDYYVGLQLPNDNQVKVFYREYMSWFRINLFLIVRIMVVKKFHYIDT